MDAGNTQQIDTIVIGAGQAGLSAGYHLAKRGLPFAILDADTRIGDHWRDRWDSLKLYSPARYDSLPGMRFPTASSQWRACRTRRADRRRLRRVDRRRWAHRRTPGRRRDWAVP